MTVRDKFTERFVLLKNTYDLTYPELTRILGTKGKSTINEWVRAQKSFPNESMLVYISDLFAVSTDWLLGRVDESYNEMILTILEIQHAVDLLSMAFGSHFIPDEYLNIDQRRKNYSLGQRANLIYIAMSAYLQTLFSMFTFRQVENGDIELKTSNDVIQCQNLLNGYVADVKDAGPLIRSELDKPVFDLEDAIRKNKNA
ncbi:hypothetical protein [Pectinatus haikarae]|uniref:Transcriptional regulator with XRE-family HTH domain n=1 Tax=Pectinatus haikarae TaxID=349096 RepID=A0ABT9Y8F0_9FIRM|nr:hypothetical protein [Pectinatus haikarae]MDQ0204110.1 transcriptional regulator with XRE-family HTH domain [Pectinatus haikarae]